MSIAALQKTRIDKIRAFYYAHQCSGDVVEKRLAMISQAYYQLLRARGKKHHAAVRALAFKWIRVLFPCWKNRVPYNEQHYLEALKKRRPPLLKHIAPVTLWYQDKLSISRK